MPLVKFQFRATDDQGKSLMILEGEDPHRHNFMAMIDRTLDRWRYLEWSRPEVKTETLTIEITVSRFEDQEEEEAA